MPPPQRRQGRELQGGWHSQSLERETVSVLGLVRRVWSLGGALEGGRGRHGRRQERKEDPSLGTCAVCRSLYSHGTKRGLQWKGGGGQDRRTSAGLGAEGLSHPCHVFRRRTQKFALEIAARATVVTYKWRDSTNGQHNEWCPPVPSARIAYLRDKRIVP